MNRPEQLRIHLSWQQAFHSFWFVPGALALGCLLASIGMVSLDRWLAFADADILPDGYRLGYEGARTVLSTIAGSMITVAGVVYSMTLVALTLAAGNLGVRLLDEYTENIVTKVSLGAFVGTFVFALGGLWAASLQAEGAVPQLTTLAAAVLALTSFGLLIYFIHDLSNWIQIDNVVARIGHQLIDALDREDAHPSGIATRVFDQNDSFGAPAATVAACRNGYIRAIDREALFDEACEQDVMIRLRFRPGQFIVAGETLAEIHGAAVMGETVERLSAAVEEAVVIGRRRTREDDPEFSVNLLVEVACRALSPSNNDFFTALSCVDYLAAAFANVARNPTPPLLWLDRSGSTRLAPRELDFRRLADAAFTPLRQSAGRNNLASVIRLLECLERIIEAAGRRCDRDCLLDHARLIAAESCLMDPVQRDREDIATILKRVETAASR